mmetsp:Transcript_75119/g.244191  ORF Transcript_75119/g.244191 Transcript_75119/m.244191 type:complete len:218 (+) Transcript_75119:687-1340(+)
MVGASALASTEAPRHAPQHDIWVVSASFCTSGAATATIGTAGGKVAGREEPRPWLRHGGGFGRAQSRRSRLRSGGSRSGRSDGAAAAAAAAGRREAASFRQAFQPWARRAACRGRDVVRGFLHLQRRWRGRRPRLLRRGQRRRGRLQQADEAADCHVVVARGPGLLGPPAQSAQLCARWPEVLGRVGTRYLAEVAPRAAGLLPAIVLQVQHVGMTGR